MHPVRTCRWLLTTAAVASLLAWCASYRWSGWAYNDTYCARLTHGAIVYGTYEHLVWPSTAPTFDLRTAKPDDDRFFFCHEAQLRVPMWGLISAAALPAAGLWWPVLRRRPSGTCARCGYSLAGLAASRCPECGHAPTAPPRPA